MSGVSLVEVVAGGDVASLASILVSPLAIDLINAPHGQVELLPRLLAVIVPSTASPL